MMKIFFWFCLSLLPLSAFAEILVEPYLSYASLKESGSLTISGIDAELEEQTVKGFMPGARLGLTWGKLAFGIDYTTAELDQEGKDYRMTNLGGFIMGKFNNFRIWGGYIFSSKYESSLEIEDINNNIFSEEGVIEGTGPKVGFGYHVLKHFSVNLEWMSLTYDKENFDLLDSVDIKNAGVLLSLGFPFSF